MLAACGRQDAGTLAGRPGTPGKAALISAGLLVPVLPRSHGQKEALCTRWAGRAATPRSPSSGLGLAELPPSGAAPEGASTITVTGVPAFSHSRPHCCSAQHPSPPGSLPSWSGPLIHRCLFLESGPFSLRVCGEGEQPHGGQPRPSRLLPQAPACCPPTTGAGGLCPQEGGTFRLSSQHILWPVPPILPPTAGAGPSALPGVLSDSPFPRGGGGRVAVRPVGSVSGPSEGLCGHPQEAEDATGPGRGRLS